MDGVTLENVSKRTARSRSSYSPPQPSTNNKQTRSLLGEFAVNNINNKTNVSSSLPTLVEDSDSDANNNNNNKNNLVPTINKDNLHANLRKSFVEKSHSSTSNDSSSEFTRKSIPTLKIGEHINIKALGTQINDNDNDKSPYSNNYDNNSSSWSTSRIASNVGIGTRDFNSYATKTNTNQQSGINHINMINVEDDDIDEDDEDENEVMSVFSIHAVLQASHQMISFNLVRCYERNEFCCEFKQK